MKEHGMLKTQIKCNLSQWELSLSWDETTFDINWYHYTDLHAGPLAYQGTLDFLILFETYQMSKNSLNN